MIAWPTDTLLYTGVLIALVLLLRRPVGRWFGPQVAYALWALPFLRLLLPPIVLPASFAPSGESNALSRPGSTSEWMVPGEPMPAESIAPAAQAVTTAWEWSGLAPFALSIWLGVAAGFLGWRVFTYRRMRRELLADARAVGDVGRIRLVETAAIAAPVAFGVRDKVVALPLDFMAQPDRAGRDLAIAHELAHHRGHDLLANFAAQVLLAMHWFNPLAWLGWRAMRRDQEAACDARVLAGRGREERALYAALIASIAAGPRLALAAPMACPVLGEKSIIHRLQSLNMRETSPLRRRIGRGLIVAGALALPATASVSYAAQSQEALHVPAPPSPPAPSAPPRAPDYPSAPAYPALPEELAPSILAPEGRDTSSGPDPVTLSHRPPLPAAPRPGLVPSLQLRGHPSSPEWQAEMARFEHEMERWGEEYGRSMEQWGHEFGEAQAARVQASVTAAHLAPEVVYSCDAAERERGRTADGRIRVVVCTDHARIARASLSQTRAAIAVNGALPAEARREAIRELDQAIARVEGR